MQRPEVQDPWGKKIDSSTQSFRQRIPPFLPSCSIQALSELGDCPPTWGGQPALLSLPMEILISSGNTFTDTPRNNFWPGIWASYGLVKLPYKLAITLGEASPWWNFCFYGNICLLDFLKTNQATFPGNTPTPHYVPFTSLGITWNPSSPQSSLWLTLAHTACTFFCGLSAFCAPELFVWTSKTVHIGDFLPRKMMMMVMFRII